MKTVKRISRRHFIERSVSGAATLAIGSTWQWVGATSAASGNDQVWLGKTGIKASRVAMGTGFRGSGHSSNQVRLGREKFVQLIRHGMDEGLNFFDMADLYGSHDFARSVLKDVSRDKVVLLSKIWWAEGAGMEPTDRAIPSVNRFRKELDTEMIDICLIHCVVDDGWPAKLKRMRDELSDLKQRGVIRATGVSCHDLGALRVAASHPWVDVIFARINNRAKVMDDPDPNVVAAVLREARSNGKAVVGMKIFGAGQLTETQQRDASLRYVWGNELVDAMTVGFERPEQIDDTVGHLTRVLQS